VHQGGLRNPAADDARCLRPRSGPTRSRVRPGLTQRFANRTPRRAARFRQRRPVHLGEPSSTRDRAVGGAGSQKLAGLCPLPWIMDFIESVRADWPLDCGQGPATAVSRRVGDSIRALGGGRTCGPVGAACRWDAARSLRAPGRSGLTTRRFDAEGRPELDVLYERFAASDVQPLWALQGLMPAAPPRRDVPFLWRAKELEALAEQAAQLVPIDRGGDRRVLALSNPGLEGLPFATSTLWGALQYLLPGEVAPAHRHTPGALRFVLRGGGVWTLVNGDPVTMSAGDLVLTPAWTWHEHHNPSDEPMCWFDGLDIPMAISLDAVFFEPGPNSDVNRAVDPVSNSEITWALGPGLLPISHISNTRHSPLVAYRWPDTDAALTRILQASHQGHAAIRFADPRSGRDVMPTLRCEFHRFAARGSTGASRRVGSSIWVVFSGSVSADVGTDRFEASEGDMFVVPSWTMMRIRAEVEPADAFCVSDEPVMAALGLDRYEEFEASAGQLS
jgi:gentisate 1,2-dioxygenase